MISDSEISRRLHELADSAGPWDDPLPAILRRAADPGGPDVVGAQDVVGARGASNVLQLPTRADASASDPGADSPTTGRARFSERTSASEPAATGDDAGDDAGSDDDDSPTGWDAKVLRPDRRRFGWKVPAAAAAAIVAGISGVVGLARLLPGADSMKSSSSAGSSFTTDAGGAQQNPASAAASSAAASAAGGTSAAASAAGGSSAGGAGAGSAPRATSTAAASGAGYAALSCSPSVRRTAAITVTAPAQLRAGRQLSAAVSIGAHLRRPAATVEIYVVGARSNAVVGALRGTVGGSASSATRSPAPLRGTLQRWSCADGNAPSRSSTSSRPLPPGSYRLVAVLLPASGAAPVVGSPAPIHILSATK